ncbi:KAP family P-loop NTPase fold protein [Vacuolonema iberomarrocanum]|uniref:KAP family P-loop NTPase fold protein n=1 Tax=Vacuolonema iberomarrocanum TaxID=3454632 RepID=UPI0019FD8927|nr:NTPase KAP [filamentous cyanobacterium LEGE 07170]
MNWRKSRHEYYKKSNSARDNVASKQTVASVDKKNNASIAVDNPIRSQSEDTLGRDKSARSFADQVMLLDTSEGIVVGVLGAWGSGKTSFINLTRSCLRDYDIAVLDFNPWMFSGAEQLVEAFFIEISAQLKIRADLADIGKSLEDYGEAFSGLGWLPLIGSWIERGRATTKVLAELLQRRKQGVSTRRSKVHRVLASLDKPIIVVLDDIDRLTTQEIRDIFKLVRLTANFPNVIYLLAFDRFRVEEALGERGIPGRDYLEKILQIGIDLPIVPMKVLNSQIFKSISAVVEKIKDPGQFDEDVWPDVFLEIIRPLIRNMRDVRRYAAAIHGTIRELDGQISLVDVLALEAIRVFLPDVFGALHGAVDSLTSTSDSYGRRDDPPHLKQQIDTLIAVTKREEIVRSLIERIFPAAQRHVGGSHYGAEFRNQWLRERRVAHEEVLRLYLERVVGERLQFFLDAEKAWVYMADRDAFETFLRSLEPERLEDVVSSLEAYEDQFRSEHVVPTSVVLLNLLPELPEQQRTMFDLDPSLVVRRIVYRLVRVLENPQVIESKVREMLPQIPSLSSQLHLIKIVGYLKDAGHELISQNSSKALEREWRDRVRSASPEALASEKELFSILLFTKREVDENEPAFVVPESTGVTYALLRSARSEVRSQWTGSRTVRRSPRLEWDSLIEIYGGEATLHQRIEDLKASQPDGADDLLQLAEQYLNGWRPKDFNEA